MPSFVENWLKNAALEVQEYVKLLLAALRDKVRKLRNLLPGAAGSVGVADA